MPFFQSRGVKLSPDIVDPDHDRQPVRLQIEHIRLPTMFQIPDGVAGDAHVRHTNPVIAVDRIQKCSTERHVAMSGARRTSFPDGRARSQSVIESPIINSRSFGSNFTIEYPPFPRRSLSVLDATLFIIKYRVRLFLLRLAISFHIAGCLLGHEGQIPCFDSFPSSDPIRSRRQPHRP